MSIITPGVYIEEQNAFPYYVVAVETMELAHEGLRIG